MKKDYINETREQRLEFDEIATNIFAPAYEVIAKEAIDKTGINKGVCLDIGSGSGHLGFAIAEVSNLNTLLFDISKEALVLAKERIKEKNLEGRVNTLLGNVEDIPMEDNSIDLCVSRGSVWFWDDISKGFEEIYRVLKPGGFAYIGGGFGAKEVAEAIDEKMLERNPEWGKKKTDIRGDSSADKFRDILNNLNISGYEIIDDETGLWAVFSK